MAGITLWGLSRNTRKKDRELIDKLFYLRELLSEYLKK